MVKRKSNLISYLLIIVSLVLIVLSFIVLNNKVLDSFEYKVLFEVSSEGAGFDINGTALTFGRIPLKGAATRKINIENKYDKNVKVKIFVSKNISDYIVAPNSFLLEPYESEMLEISVRVPENTKLGNYTGKIRIEITKA